MTTIFFRNGMNLQNYSIYGSQKQFTKSTVSALLVQ